MTTMAKTGLKLLLGFIFLVPTIAGSEVFNAMNDTCCQGKVYSKNDSDGIWYGCCGDQPMFSNGSAIPRCCDKEIRYSLKYTDVCCGNTLIDIQNFTCINGTQAMEIPQHEKLQGNTAACSNSTCEPIFFNPAKNVCCNGVLYEIKITPHHICQGTQYINFNTHVPCLQFNNETIAFQYTYVPLGDKNRSTTACCNMELYDTQSQYCLNRQIFNTDEVNTKQCCGYTYTYNTTNRKWSAEPNEDGKNEEDCDQLLLASEEAFCMQNHLITTTPLNYSQNIILCPFDYSTYNINSQTCCSGGVRDLTPEEIKDGKNICCEVIPIGFTTKLLLNMF